MRILVTGISSSLAVCVCKLAKEKSHYVIGTTRRPIDAGKPDFVDKLIYLDLLNEVSFRNLTDDDLDAVIHIAGLSYGSVSDLMKATGLGTYYLLRRVEELNARAFVHVSGISAFGIINGGTVNSETRVSYQTPYGVAKWAAETYLAENNGSVKRVSVRSPAIVGSVTAPHFLGQLVRKLINQESKVLLKHPRFLFNNLIHEQDLALYLLWLADNTPDRYCCVPVGASEAIPLVDVVSFLVNVTRYRGVVEWVASSEEPFSIDLSEAQHLGFKPSSVLETLERWAFSIDPADLRFK